MVKVGWRPIVSAVVIVAAIVAVKCYGGKSYDRGRREAELWHTDSVRKIVTAALDSQHKAMVPVLEERMRENESLKTIARESRIAAANAIGRARRAEERLHSADAALLDSAPPEVRLIVDSLLVSNDSLKVNLERVIGLSKSIEMQNDSLVKSMGEWQSLYTSARAALDTSAKEVAQLKAIKTPKKPRFGFKSGVVVGVAGTVGAIIAGLLLTH